jgi:Winged helix DNA-binding domain
VRPYSWEQACARRLLRHGLSRPLATPADAARAVVGMHAQVMSAAELALGVRTTGTTRTDVRKALWSERALVKTYGPRGTVHLVAACDLGAWCAGLSAAPWAAARRPPSMRMTDEQVDQVVGAVDAALSAADLTVDELDDEVVGRTGPWAGDLVIPGFDGWWPRWRQVIATAAYRGVLCFGPDRGRRTTYTSPRRWVPGFEGVATTYGLPDLVLDYLRSYGPATAEEAARWLGVPAGALQAAVAAMTDDLVEVDLAGSTALLPAGDADPDGEPDDRLRLLPYFDPYVVGCHPRSLLFPGDTAGRALTRGQAGTRAVVLAGGTVAGIWHHRRTARKVEVTVEPFTALSRRQLRQLDDEVERIGSILEATPTLAVGTVTAGRHL